MAVVGWLSQGKHEGGKEAKANGSHDFYYGYCGHAGHGKERSSGGHYILNILRVNRRRRLECCCFY